MGKHTPLYTCHLQANAKLVDFAGWDMPLHYGSQIHEHHTVRKDAGIFDVSHMTIADVTGKDAAPYLRYLMANNIDRLTEGKALYTCMLNEQGGVMDDLIIYKINDHFYRLVVNAATHDKDLNWLNKQKNHFDVALQERTDLALLALQGPHVVNTIPSLFAKEHVTKLQTLKPFHAFTLNHYFIARTGYTGEDGFEIMLPRDQAPAFWQKCLTSGITPCGLGARDTLRLEAGLNLYGTDMDETVTPLESNLAWTVAWEPNDRVFIGRTALEKQRAAKQYPHLVGLVLEAPGVLRNHQKIWREGEIAGEITSGSFSPTLQKGIALGRLLAPAENSPYTIELRGKRVPIHIIKPPFVRNGQPTFLFTEQST